MLDEIEKNNLFELNTVHGIFPANADGDDIVVYEPSEAFTAELAEKSKLNFESSDVDNQKNNTVKSNCCGSHNHGGCGCHSVGTKASESVANGCKEVSVYTKANLKEMVRFNTLRRQDEIKGEKHVAIADYIAPKEAGIPDYLGAFTVAVLGADELAKKFENEGDNYKAILVKVLADRFAEALAERLHELVRNDYWGYSKKEELTNEQLLKAEYVGIRPAIGYPSIPDHSEKLKLQKLLNFERIGVSLTESYMMKPVSSVCGLYFAHSQAKYFDVGRIYEEQLLDYSKRKQMTKEELRKIMPNRIV